MGKTGVAAAYVRKSEKRAGRYFKKIRNFNKKQDVLKLRGRSGLCVKNRNFGKNQDIVKFTLVSLFRIKSA
jgi:hypothetical protein